MFYYFAIIQNIVKSKSMPDFCDRMHQYSVDKLAYHHQTALSYSYPACREKGYNEFKSNALFVPCIYHTILGLLYWNKCYTWQDRKFYHAHPEVFEKMLEKSK